MAELAEPVWAFAKHLVTEPWFLTIFVFNYIRVTPHKEVALIRAGNGVAALGLLSAVVRFSIALVAEIGAQFIAEFMFPKLYTAIEENNWAAAIMKAGTAIAVGMVNAACMTP